MKFDSKIDETIAKEFVSKEIVGKAKDKVENEFVPIPLKDIDAVIEAAQLSSRDIMELYQNLACSALYHVAKHGDIRVARKLLASLHDGMHKASMCAFFDKYGTIEFDDEGECYYNAEKKLKLGEALNTKWYKAKKQPTYTPFNLADELQKLLSRGMKRIDKADGAKGDFVTAETLNRLADLVNEVNAAERKVTGEPTTDAEVSAQLAVAA